MEVTCTYFECCLTLSTTISVLEDIVCCHEAHGHCFDVFDAFLLQIPVAAQSSLY